MSINRISKGFILIYLVAILFFYPYGLTIAGGNFRIPDFVAFPTIFLSLASVFIRGRMYSYPLLLSVVALFIFAELFFPLLAVLIGYEGLGGLANSMRMALIWLPVFSYAISNPPVEGYKLDGAVNKILRLTVLINIAYGILQMGVRASVLPDAILVTKALEPFAVDDHFRIQDGFRASGFFTNTSSLSIFGVVSLSYFFARFIDSHVKRDGIFAVLSFILVLMTLSRAAIFTSVFVILVCWMFLSKKIKIISLIVFSGFIAVCFYIIEQYIGIEILFNRFILLYEYGLEYDNSFGARLYRIWPAALKNLQAYPYGTFSSPSEKIGLIDSGYLTYYAQGKWLFIIILFLFLASIVKRGLKAFSNKHNWANIMLLSIGLYVVGSMTVLIPLKSPLIIYFLLFGIWLSEPAGRRTRDKSREIIPIKQ